MKAITDWLLRLRRTPSRPPCRLQGVLSYRHITPKYYSVNENLQNPARIGVGVHKRKRRLIDWSLFLCQSEDKEKRCVQPPMEMALGRCVLNSRRPSASSSINLKAVRAATEHAIRKLVCWELRRVGQNFPARSSIFCSSGSCISESR